MAKLLTVVLPLVLLLVLLLLPATPCGAASPALVASGTLLPCVGTAVNPLEPAGCLRKLVVELRYTPSSTGASAEALAAISSVTDLTLVPGSAHPSTATLADGGLRATVGAAALSVEYALTYQREYAMQAYASMISLGVDQCASHACGGYTQVDGTVVSRTNGVCCACSTCATSTCAADSLLTLLCGSPVFQGTMCFQSSEPAYDGYGIGTGSLRYPVRVLLSGLGLTSEDGDSVLAFDVNATPAGTTVSQHAHVGGTGVSALPTTLEAAAQGLRDAAAVDGHVLFAPAGTASGADEWVVLPPSLVTVDGTECDKVGVSPETYYRLAAGNTCTESRSWCLHHQLLDYVSRAQGGGDPNATHMASSMGAFSMSPSRDVLVRTAQDGDGLVVLRWTASADDVTYTTDPSAGALDAAVHVVDAATGGSSLAVVVRNSGVRASWFRVHVESCRGGPTPAGDTPRVVLDASASASVSLALLGGAPTGASAACTVVLSSSSGVRVDDRTVTWHGADTSTTSTTSTSTTAPAPSTTTTPVPSEAPMNACAACLFRDVSCLVRRVCVGPLYAWLGIAACALLAVWCLLYWRGAMFPCVFGPAEDIGSRLFAELREEHCSLVRMWDAGPTTPLCELRSSWSDED